MGCQEAVFLSGLSTAFHTIVVDYMTSGLSLVSKQWFGVSKDMLL